MFEIVRDYYNMGLYTKEDVRYFYMVGLINVYELEEIIGKDEKGV